MQTFQADVPPVRTPPSSGGRALEGNHGEAGPSAGFSFDGMTAPLRDAQAYVRQQYKYHDRGTGKNEQLRKQSNQPYLVMTGQCAPCLLS